MFSVSFISDINTWFSALNDWVPTKNLMLSVSATCADRARAWKKNTFTYLFEYNINIISLLQKKNQQKIDVNTVCENKQCESFWSVTLIHLAN